MSRVFPVAFAWFVLSGLACVVLWGCSGIDHPPSARIHYLGHASVLMEFSNGVTVLTDYGESKAYGLDSPIHGLGGVVPDVVTLSHDHADHAGGILPEGVGIILEVDKPYHQEGLTVTPIPTFEGNLDAPDNRSFLFEFGNLKVLHLGDCQALMGATDDPEVRERIRTLYPHQYDLVLMPIGSVRDILAEAVAFAALLDARRIVPIHFWSPPDRDIYLRMMEESEDVRGRAYRARTEPGPAYQLKAWDGVEEEVEIIGLTPGPPG